MIDSEVCHVICKATSAYYSQINGYNLVKVDQYLVNHIYRINWHSLCGT